MNKQEVLIEQERIVQKMHNNYHNATSAEARKAYSNAYNAAVVMRECTEKIDEPSANLITELCPHCETEITMEWSVEERGYKAFCPCCGKRLMLCSECKGCDYEKESDSCRFNPSPPEGCEKIYCKTYDLKGYKCFNCSKCGAWQVDLPNTRVCTFCGRPLKTEGTK